MIKELLDCTDIPISPYKTRRVNLQTISNTIYYVLITHKDRILLGYMYDYKSYLFLYNTHSALGLNTHNIMNLGLVFVYNIESVDYVNVLYTIPVLSFNEMKHHFVTGIIGK